MNRRSIAVFSATVALCTLYAASQGDPFNARIHASSLHAYSARLCDDLYSHAMAR